MRVVFIFTVAILSVTVFAKDKKPSHTKTQLEKNAEMSLTVQKGSEITIDKFDTHTQIFMITINSMPGVGPNFTTGPDLKDAIQFDGDLAAFMKQKNQMTGSVYQLKKELKLLSEKQVVDRIHHAK